MILDLGSYLSLAETHSGLPLRGAKEPKASGRPQTIRELAIPERYGYFGVRKTPTASEVKIVAKNKKLNLSFISRLTQRLQIMLQ